MPSSCVYRVDDPIENFKLRIRVRELSRLQIPRENDSARLDQSFIVSWQQKVYSPWEIEDFLKHRTSSEGSQREIANRKRLARLESPKQPVVGLLEPTMLFTYVDGDGYSPAGEKSVLASYSGDYKESYIASAMRSTVADDDLDRRQAKLRERLTRERTCQTMHVCLATDVNTTTPAEQDKATEHLLCTVHLYSDGMLEISPDFSELLEEAEKGVILAEQVPVSGIFASDRTAATALRKGLRIGTHSLRSASGSDFEYTIENLNGVIMPTEVEEFEKKAQVNALARSLKFRGVRGPESSWLQDPPKETFNRSVAMNVEVVSAKGFDGRELFICYEVVCPENWDLRTGNLNDGVASEDSGSEKSFSEQDEEEAVLIGRTQLATVHESFNSAHNTSSSPGNSGDISLLMPGGNIIWGSLFFVVACIAVVVGPSYGFWIVPAIVIVIVLGTGTPGGGSNEIVYLSEKDRMNMNWGGKYELYKGDSAPGFSIPTDGADGLVIEPVASFGHPISMSFDVRDDTFETGLAPSGAYPVILIEVYSTQLLGGNTLEGYGYAPLRDLAGYEDFTVSTWRPVGSRYSRMMEFFVGGNPVLHHPIFSEMPNKMSSSLSRFGVLTEGSGCVRFRVNTICTDPRKKEALKERLLRAQPDGANKTFGRRSVDDIVNHFKQVEALNRSINKSGVFTATAMSALGKSTDMSRSMGRSPDGVLMSSAARAERVQQILNRAKSRVATLTKHDTSAGPTRVKPCEISGGRRLGLRHTSEDEQGKEDEDPKDRDDEKETTPLLGRPPIRRMSGRGEAGNQDLASEYRARTRLEKDEIDQWDAFETPVRVRRSSPSLEESPLLDESVTNVRHGMDGVQSPAAAEGGAADTASETDPLTTAPRTLSGANARLRQFQREKSLGVNDDPALELRPIAKRTGQKFLNPKKGALDA